MTLGTNITREAALVQVDYLFGIDESNAYLVDPRARARARVRGLVKIKSRRIFAERAVHFSEASFNFAREYETSFSAMKNLIPLSGFY